MARVRWAFGVLVLAGVAAVGVSHGIDRAATVTQPTLVVPPPRPRPTPPDTATILGSMASLVGASQDPNELAEWVRKIDGGEPIGSYIDELLRDERFGREVVPALLFGAFVNVRNYYALPSGFILKQSTDDGTPVFYLRAPCAPRDAIAVRPWWSLGAEVKVCPDAYRPEKWTMQPEEHSYRSRMVLTCDSQVGSPELETKPLCGCGPNLIRCLRDEEHYEQLNRSLMNEVKQTTAYVVDQDLPLAALFTGNATFRDRNAELYYRRQKIGALEVTEIDDVLGDLATWPRDGKWARREELRPGQHAGVLTAPQILHWLPDRRQRQRGYYEILWCTMRNSFGATTHKVLELNATGNIAFVHDSWERLAHTELCTNCHARLDYGFQFFMGYPDSRASTHFNPALQSTGSGPLYGQDIQDHRGDAELTPVGFAKLATEQPDFRGCMSNHVIEYVLGERATAEDRRAIEAALEETARLKPTMKVALERYVARWRERPPELIQPPAVAASHAPATVAISPPLRAKLDDYCVDCHDKAPYSESADADAIAFDFRPAQLPRALVVGMTDHVAYGTMPKTGRLDGSVRDELVTLLIHTLWTDPAARAEAESYYLGKAHGLPAHQVDNALSAIDRFAKGSSGIAWGALERGIWSDQSTVTPGFLAVTGLEALRACVQHGGPLEPCLRDTTSLRLLSRWPIVP